jgi:hypothetical protein
VRRKGLRARSLSVKRLDVATRDAMWRIFETHYEGASRAEFEGDLDAKQWAIVARDAEGRVQGFSTLDWSVVPHDGRQYGILYSGDTVVARPYWGDGALQAAFLRRMALLWARRPWRPAYWFLISKGYKTYLLLTRNFPEHWPRHDRPTPPPVASLLDSVARQRFGPGWDPQSGIVRGVSGGRVAAGLAPITAEQLARPDIAYFAERNPGHVDGDELACLGRLSPKILVAYASKRRVRRRSA